MKSQIILFTLLAFGVLVLWQCQRITYTSSDFPDQRLSFGSGGGFTGAVTTYHLLPNGQIFKSEGLVPDTTLLFSVKKGEAKAFFKQADEEQLLNIEFNYPGNMYYFINYHTKEEANKITWGGTDAKIAPAIISFYQKLNDLTKEQPSK